MFYSYCCWVVVFYISITTISALAPNLIGKMLVPTPFEIYIFGSISLYQPLRYFPLPWGLKGANPKNEIWPPWVCPESTKSIVKLPFSLAIISLCSGQCDNTIFVSVCFRFLTAFLKLALPPTKSSIPITEISRFLIVIVLFSFLHPSPRWILHTLRRWKHE